jgi:hypothetical protein
LSYFLKSCHQLHLEDIERRDLLKFSALLRDEKEQAPRTGWNRFSNLMSFLKASLKQFEIDLIPFSDG